jgi:hypothetical protein
MSAGRNAEKRVRRNRVSRLANGHVGFPVKHVFVIIALTLLVPACVRLGHDARASSVVVTAEAQPTPLLPETATDRASEARAPHYRIDWDFIQAVEGRPRLHGYVPTASGNGRVLGRSGVTVATGFDLGQHDAADLRRMGLAQRLVTAVEPYLQHKGPHARSLLRHRPLVLAPREADALDRAKRLDTARKIERRFDATRAGHVPPFAGLSAPQQTVIFSLATQYGSRLDRKTPAFWQHVTHGRFDRARRELRNFGDRYPTRRNREADLLLRERHAVSLASR